MYLFRNCHYRIPTSRFIFQHAETSSEGPRQESTKTGKEVPKDTTALEALVGQQALNVVLDAAIRRLEKLQKAGSQDTLKEIAAGLNQVADNPYVLLGDTATDNAQVYPWIKEAILKPKEGKK